ncbi:MAG: WD40/YVTN/BNR-like repeat-containing protein [Actinomycetota bacterium]
MRVVVATTGGLFTFSGSTRAALEGREIGAIAARGDEMWAVVDRHSLWKSADGDRWEPVTMVEERSINCLLPLDDSVLVGTSEAHLFSVEGEEVDEVSSLADAPGRSEWFTPWGGAPDVRSLSRASSGTVFVNVHVGGILRTPDLDRWAATIEIESDVHEVLAAEDALYAATAWGLAISDDEGDSWSYEREGLHATYARAVAVGSETVLMSSSEGPRGRRSALYRRESEGAGFVKCDGGLPDWFAHNIDSGYLAASGPVAAFATEEGGVFLSEDGGGAWRLLADGLPPARSVLVYT